MTAALEGGGSQLGCLRGVSVGQSIPVRFPKTVNWPWVLPGAKCYKGTTVGTYLRAPAFLPPPAVEIDTICPIPTRTLWVIHDPPPSALITFRNIRY